MMQDGEYKTANGSAVRITHGKVSIAFDWMEEGNACFDCVVSTDIQHSELHWNCDICGCGSAKLVSMRGE